jgi:hypothetical protein
MYMRILYRTFFWGPFDDEAAVIAALRKLDKEVPDWDDDPFCVIFGADPLPKDYVFGFPSVPMEMRDRIDQGREAK